jgi:thiol:disulfide interchange protein
MSRSRLLTLSLLFILFTATSFSASAQEAKGGIHFFFGTFDEALSEAEKQNKPVFMDAYTLWCGPCKYMSAYVFTDQAVADFYNENFINVKMDMEHGEGPVLARTYGVRAYPTLFYLNPDGSVLKKHLGGMKPEGFLQMGQSVSQSYNP